jgi:hypothetical protein
MSVQGREKLLVSAATRDDAEAEPSVVQPNKADAESQLVRFNLFYPISNAYARHFLIITPNQ